MVVGKNKTTNSGSWKGTPHEEWSEQRLYFTWDLHAGKNQSGKYLDSNKSNQRSVAWARAAEV